MEMVKRCLIIFLLFFSGCLLGTIQLTDETDPQEAYKGGFRNGARACQGVSEEECDWILFNE